MVRKTVNDIARQCSIILGRSFNLERLLRTGRKQILIFKKGKEFLRNLQVPQNLQAGKGGAAIFLETVSKQ